MSALSYALGSALAACGRSDLPWLPAVEVIALAACGRSDLPWLPAVARSPCGRSVALASCLRSLGSALAACGRGDHPAVARICPAVDLFSEFFLDSLTSAKP